MSDGSGKTAWSYDQAGHILTERRTVGAITKTIANLYNLDGSVAQKTYPSGNLITYSYSNAQRVLSVVNSATHQNFALNATYSPDGQLAGMLNGQSGSFGGITYSRSFNNRLQLTASSAASSNGTAMNFGYSYDQSGGVNNGDLVNLTNNQRQYPQRIFHLRSAESHFEGADPRLNRPLLLGPELPL